MLSARLVAVMLCVRMVSVCASEIDPKLFRDFDAAFVLFDTSSKTYVRHNPGKCALPLAPCSTFKIWNTLIGLELGFVKDPEASFYKWDGVARGIEAWNRDLTFKEAFHVSCVPAFQALARSIGAERMRQYVVEVLRYGDGNLAAGVDRFWLPSVDGEPLRITPNRQVELLSALLAGGMDFKEVNVRTLRGVMLALRTERGTLYGKTGSGRDSGNALGWYVGFVESRGRTWVFACAITGDERSDGKTARSIVEDVLRSQELL